MNKKFTTILMAVFVILVILSLFNVPATLNKKPDSTQISALVNKVKQGEVKSIAINGNKLSAVLNDGNNLVTYKEATDSLSTLLSNYEVPADKLGAVEVTVKEAGGFSYLLLNILPFLIPFIFIAAFVYFIMRQAQRGQNKAMLFGETRAKPATLKQKITFNDIAGAKEAKTELYEVVEFLKNPKKFTSMGAKVPKGVLLLGSPGCGKTLLSRAVAGEAGVPFYNISGSEFVEMFVGVGASRVRDLFLKAKKTAPSIIFIDELDAVGRQRGTGLGGGHDEREQTLNQILVEMDGFDQDTNIIVMAATNRPDVLDPALLRPGRFDRRVMIDMPDINDREAILLLHAKNKPLEPTVELRRIAERTPGFSGADLANLLNEAAITAARKGQKTINSEDVLDSIEKVLLGPTRSSHLLSPKEKEITAFHEAGHAIISHLLPNCDPVRKVSIVSRGQAAGFTLSLPSKETYLKSKAQFLDELVAILGGYSAEELLFGEVTTGSGNDLKQATLMARKVVMDYGMSSKLGPRTFGKREEMVFLGREISEQRDYSEKIAQEIDTEVSDLINTAHQRAHQLLIENRAKLDKVAQTLLTKEVIEQQEFEQLLSS